MMQKRILIAGLGVIGLLITLYLVISAVVYYRIAPVDALCLLRDIEATFTPDNFHPGQYPPPEFSTLPYLMPSYETVTFPSRDTHITISGFYMPAQGLSDPTTAPAVIIIHGLNDCKRRTFILTAAGMLNKQGFNVLAIDLRDHGDSTIEDGRQAGGTEEFRDVLGSFDWLIREKHIAENRIGLMGFSLGASTALIAAGEEPRIAAVWSDSAYGDLGKIISTELQRNGIPAFWGPGVVFVGQVVSGDYLLGYRPLAEVAKLNGRPLYIVHGSGDTRIDVINASEIAEVANANGGRVTPWITDSRHVESIFYHTDEYEQRLIAFFQQSLP
jgi:uncharacterized protein